MGKPKKGKKGRQDDDFGDDDNAVDPIAQAEVVESEDVVTKDATKAGKKGKGKKGKRADDDWEEDVSKEIEALSLGKEPEVTNGDTDEPKPTSGKSKKKDKKKKQQQKEEDEEEDDMAPAITKGKSKGGMSAFAMLDIEDVEPEEEEEEEVEVMPAQKKNKKNKKAKSIEEESTDEPEPQPQPTKGNKKEKKKNEEEDIDAILAEFEKPAEKSEGKKKKKKKEKLEPSGGAEESASGFELVDIESMTQEQIAMLLGGDDDEEDDRKKKKKEKKKKKKGAEVAAAAAEEKEEEQMDEGEEKMDETKNEEGEEGEEGGTVKTAAQKKKEKRERQKQQKMLEKQKQASKPVGGKKEEEAEKVTEEAATVSEEAQKSDGEEGGDDDDDKKKSKKDRRKKKGAKEVKEEEEKKKKPGNKQLRAMQEALQRVKEEEEAMRKAEEEKERKLEELRTAKLEAAAAEAEKKERDKQKKKEKIERQKREGTFKTKAQKEAEKRAREMLAARGLEIPARLAGTGAATPEGGEPKRKRIVYDSRPRRKKQQEVTSPTSDTPQSPEAETPTPTIEEKMLVEEAPKEEEKEEEVADSWEMVEDKLDEEENVADVKEIAVEPVTKEVEKEEEEDEEEDEEDEEEEEESSEEEDESSEEESSSEDDSSEDEDMSVEDRAFHKAEKRIQRRRELAESKRNKDVLRAPVVCVLGHVDTGKTKILDKLRRTNVQDGEAGGITQQIGATNVPREAIQDKTLMCKDFTKKELKLPGLLIIDTPGHESFSNLRNRGSSLCDIAILVVDIMHGLEPQTIESINLLKSRKTPFVVALNKIDRLFGWKPNPHSDVVNTIKKQSSNTKIEFEERVQMIQVQFAEQGLNVTLFHENKNPREYISMCPTSAHSGDGMGNLVALICELSQSFLAERVAYIDDLQSTVMEVKAIPGLGMTIDVILVNGSLREGSTIVVAGTEGPIVTSIRGLLMPQPMKELRVKGAYLHQKEVKAAQGVKIIAKDLDKALAGLPLYVAKYDDEIAVYRADLEQSLEAILKGIKVQQEGVFVQASTLGSLEALLEFLRTSKIPYAGINIGPVHRRDIMRASVMLERDSQYACVLAFDVKVEREAQEMADNLGVRIFTADIIYHLFDAFTAYRAELKRKKQEEFKFIAVFPCKLRILPNCVFNTRDPIVVGVAVEAGFIKEGTPLCVPSKEFLEIGRVTSIENNHKAVDRAAKGNEVCIKIEPIPGEAPKLFGRHFDHTDILMSKISRASIDAVKDYFREDMSKNDWALIKEMKALFEIL